MLEKELRTYDEKRKELLPDGGKFVVIAGDKILGIYTEYEEALQVGYTEYGLNPFLVKRIEQDKASLPVRPENQCSVPRRKMTVPITPLGPVTLIGVGVSQVRRKALQLINREFPARRAASALLDTGSSGTMVDSAIISTLGLAPRDTTRLITPSTGSKAVDLYVYDLSIWLLGSQPGDTLEILTQAIGTNLKRHGVGMLLGRDILADCIMLYNGASKTCTLSF